MPHTALPEDENLWVKVRNWGLGGKPTVALPIISRNVTKSSYFQGGKMKTYRAAISRIKCRRYLEDLYEGIYRFA